MEKSAKVYVIIPIYNVEPYLRECLDSVVNQTYHNLKIILVNDGSTDSSESIAREYLNDERVTLISKENGGQSSARNVGLQKAYLEGEDEDYILFLDSDDYLELFYIENMVSSFKRNPQCVLSLGGVQSFNQEKLLERSVVMDKKIFYSGIEFLASVSNHYFCFVVGGGGFS